MNTTVRFTISARVEGSPYETWDLPDAEVAESLLSRLDSERYSELTVTRHVRAGPSPTGDGPPYSEEAALIIVGGADDRVYVGYMAPDGEETWTQNYLNATEPSRGDEPEVRVGGGQKTRLPARWWVNRAVALLALRYFVRLGQPDPSIPWERTNPH